jgi:hypothetical protein
MKRSILRSAPLLVLLAASLTLPVPADAQLGGLARKAKAAAKAKADDKVDEALYVPPPPPTFDDRLLEITEPRLAGMLEGLKAEAAFAKDASAKAAAEEAAYERAMKAYEKAEKEYNAKLESWGACVERFRASEEEAKAANEARVEKALDEMGDDEFATYVEDLALRGEAIARDAEAGKNDPATQRRREAYVLEAAAMQAEQVRRAALAMAGMAAESHRERTEDPRLVEACGKEPEPPIPPESFSGPEGTLAREGAVAAGLNGDQYALMRERLLYWAREDGRPSGMGFSEAEMSTLTGKKDGIDEAVKKLRDAKVPF